MRSAAGGSLLCMSPLPPKTAGGRSHRITTERSVVAGRQQLVHCHRPEQRPGLWMVSEDRPLGGGGVTPTTALPPCPARDRASAGGADLQQRSGLLRAQGGGASGDAQTGRVRF